MVRINDRIPKGGFPQPCELVCCFKEGLSCYCHQQRLEIVSPSEELVYTSESASSHTNGYRSHLEQGLHSDAKM